MRILFVKPHAKLPTIIGLGRLQRLEPLEFGYLAAAIPPEHELRVLDLRLYRSPLAVFRRTLQAFGPDLIAFTSYSHESATTRALAELAKAMNPAVKVLLGGHHATVAPSDCNVPQIDYIIRGEGTSAFAELVAALARGVEPEGIENFLRTGDRFDDRVAAAWPQYPDPASIPMPRRDLWNAADYYCVWAGENPKRWQRLFPPVAMMRTSYGCKMKCTFCVVPHLCNGQHRPKPIDRILEELRTIGPDHIYLADDESFINEEFAAELAEAIAKAGIKKRFFAWARATTVLKSPDLFAKWREIGLDAAFVGFEFPSDDQLRSVKKGSTVAANEKAQIMLREMGIGCHIGFMTRAEDTEADFQRLKDYVSALPPAQFSFTVCTPSPGTRDYTDAKPTMWVDDAYPLHDCMHPLTPTVLPLKKFGALLGDLLRHAARRNPLRVENHLIRPWELARVLYAEHQYVKAFENMWRDYPIEIQSWAGESSPRRTVAANPT